METEVRSYFDTTGDNWIIECIKNDIGGEVFGMTQFYLKHKDTGYYLYTDKASMFNNRNCRRCPIIGQSEVSGIKSKPQTGGVWQVISGFFFPPLDAPDENSSDPIDDSDDYDYTKEDL